MIAPTNVDRAQRLAEGLYPHQVDGVAFLLARRRAILADDMGLGKTRQSILALVEAEGEGPFLVVCPASVKLNWVREIHIALGDDAEVHLVDRQHPVPREPFHGWVVINYSILKRHFDTLADLDFKGMVFDEAHYLKNHRSQRSKTSRELVRRAERPPRIHCLTGTPLTNRPRDLFPLLQLTNHPLGRNFLTFARRYCDAHRNEWGWVADGASNIEELTVQLHRTMLRRRKEDVLDLPNKIRTWLPVEIPESTGRRETRRLLEEMIEARAHGKQPVGEGLEGPNRIALLSRISPARKRIAIAKVKNTIEFVEGIVDQGEKVIVYSCFTPPSEMVEKHFGDRAVKITGKTPTGRRQRIVDAFQNDDSVRVMAANIIAAGVGVNLTAARSVVFNDLDWVPANHWQAEDRAYRIGQEHPVNVYYFSASGTLEEFMGEVLEAKSRLIVDVVDARALTSEGAHSADVLSELQRMIARVSGQMSDEESDHKGAVDRLLREAVQLYRAEFEEAEFYSGPYAERRAGPKPVITPEAIEALARSLDPPTPECYRMRNRKGDDWYTLEVDGPDVACSCRGFYYRGKCRHAGALEKALSRGGAIPPEFEPAA